MSSYKTNIKDNALKGIANGARIANNIAKKTAGPYGINVSIEVEEFPFSISTDDGATAIEHMDFSDPLEKRGLGYMKEVVGLSNENAQDGSTASCAIFTKTVEEGSIATEKEIVIKKSIDELLPFIEEEIKAQTRQIEIADVEKVASVAAKSKEKGKILREIYEKIGRTGIIYPQGNFSFDGVTRYTISHGIRFKQTGYLTKDMVHDEEAVKLKESEKRAIYYKPTILVTKRKINTINDIEPLIKTLTDQGKKDLVIFTDDMDSGVASMLIKAHKDKIINCLIIKAPVLYKNSVFEDFAKCTGATIVEDATGITFKNLPISALGTCEVLMVDAENTVILGSADITEHVEELKKKSDVESKLRVNWLSEKSAILEIGARSESDLSYHRLKYDDAIGSAYGALQHGIVAGGGITLYNVAQKLPDTVGGRILKKALCEPFKQLCENSSITPDYDKIGGEMGYNLETGEIVNMFEEGLVDAANIIKSEVMNGVGVASTAITTPYLITLPEKTPEQIALETMKGRGLMPNF